MTRQPLPVVSPGDGFKVLHLSAALPHTGAGGAALSTHDALRKRGIASKILFLIGSGDEARGIYSFASTPLLALKRLVVTTLDRIPVWRYRTRAGEVYSAGLFGQTLKEHPLVRWADLIHLNWINHGFVDVGELASLNKPIVWTMHDMWPFTGGCHHALECERYTASCGSCPVLQSTDPKDLSRRVHRMKANVYPGIAVAWVGVSSWMAESASRSSLLAGRNVSVIHSGIDVEIFQPQDKASARRALHLPVERRVVLLGAHDLSSPYKGVQYSVAALRGLNADCVIATFGHGQIDATGMEARVTHLGFVTGAPEMAQVYSAADVVLATSVADAFGKTVAEAQCCGVPVVAFNDTGPRDIVEHRVTGYLASARDSGDVLFGLRYCLESRFDHGYISRRARDAFSIERCTEQYVELYRMALAAPSS